MFAANTEEAQWFVMEHSNFKKAQNDKNTSITIYFSKLYDTYDELYPIVPTDKEVEAADGDAEKACADKVVFRRQVRYLMRNHLTTQLTKSCLANLQMDVQSEDRYCTR